MPGHRRWAGLVLLVLLIGAGMVVVAVWGDDLRSEVHAVLQNVARLL